MDRNLIMEHLSLAERHVSESTARVERQRELVKQVQQDGHDIDQALKLLSQFEELLAMQIQDRDRMRAWLVQGEQVLLG
jgi:hypothetical protein